MTPNYLCSPKALHNLATSLGTPGHLRFILLVKAPLDFLTTAYKMFVHWRWVRSANLSTDVGAQLSALRRCHRTLFDAPHTNLPRAFHEPSTSLP